MKRTPFKKKPKKQKSERDVLTKEIDTLLSLWIRQSNQVNGLTSCSTCQKSYPWRQIQNGHYQSRRFTATRFSEKNCAPQCARCNCWGATELSGIPGEGKAMEVWLDRKWGEGTAGMMKRESRMYYKPSIVALQIMKRELTEKLESNGYETR